jgi:predicted RNA-binding Zn-ribbon protein involved in translation (DUF1610 family)
MSALTADIPCPKCGAQEMWDNRTTKRNPNAPDYKCKDKACDGCVWPPRNGSAPVARPATAATVKQPISIGAPVAGIDTQAVDKVASDFALYSRCIDHARVEVIRTGIDKLGGDVAGAVAAIAATLYIQAHK